MEDQTNPLSMRVFVLFALVAATSSFCSLIWAWLHFDYRLDTIDYQMGILKNQSESAAQCPPLAEESRINEKRIETLTEQVEALSEVADQCSTLLKQ